MKQIVSTVSSMFLWFMINVAQFHGKNKGERETGECQAAQKAT